MNIVIYGTSTCPFCVQAENLLKQAGQTTYQKIDISVDKDQFEFMLQRTGKRTVPQIFIDDQYVGGYTELLAFMRAKKN